MSGGHWNYLGFKLEKKYQHVNKAWELLAVMEHELDWGLSSDTCLGCARKRVVAALEAFFDKSCEDSTTAIAVARDHLQNQCIKHKRTP